MKKLDDINKYLNNIRGKNKENSINYDRLISECSYITNTKDLDKLKNILEELKEENKDFYDYIVYLLKTSNDLNTLFLLYKEYKESKIREEVLDKEVKDKSIEFDNIKKDLDDKEYDIRSFDKVSKKLKDMGKILDDISSTISINLNDTLSLSK